MRGRQIVERRRYEAIGVQELCVSMRDDFQLEPIHLFGETVISVKLRLEVHHSFTTLRN